MLEFLEQIKKRLIKIFYMSLLVAVIILIFISAITIALFFKFVVFGEMTASEFKDGMLSMLQIKITTILEPIKNWFTALFQRLAS